MVGLTQGHLFAVDLENKAVRIAAELPGSGRVARDAADRFLGRDKEGTLWRYAPESDRLERRVLPLPAAGEWEIDDLCWARDPRNGGLYAADAAGRLFALDADSAWSSCLGQAPLAPVGPMAATLDGRLFGFCGDGIARLFKYEPGQAEVVDLGGAASVVERRRYGYAFGDAAVGRDGEIVFGEADDLGHVWLYFPRIASC
jgi:hypothetical protein